MLYTGKSWRGGGGIQPGCKFDNINFSLEGTYTAKQFLINEELDYLTAPDAYFLLNANFAAEKKLEHKRFS